MNAGGHAGQRSRVQSHIQRASEKQAHLPAICATACEMVRSSTKTVAHAATLSLTRSPAVTLCNGCSFKFVRRGQVLPHPALPLHRRWRRAPYDAERPHLHHAQPARTGSTQAAPVFIAQKPLPADGSIRAQGLTVGLPSHRDSNAGRNAWRSMHVSRLLHKRVHGYTNTLRLSPRPRSPRSPHPHPACAGSGFIFSEKHARLLKGDHRKLQTQWHPATTGLSGRLART